MKVLEVHGASSRSQISIGEKLNRLKGHVDSSNVIVITDTNVHHLYGGAIPFDRIIEVEAGETAKSLKVVEHVYRRLIELEADRTSSIVGVGGGVVCDVTGFVASTYMRGVDFGFVATTLLAQVDASVGGKNGINISDYKNMVGVFNQPRFVICDLELLGTLPRAELLNGFAEAVKSAAIGDAKLFEFLEGNYKKALDLDLDIIERVVCDSLGVKIPLVEADERESGERRKLNLGHTIGHTIERATGISHGEAVSVGMVMASRMSVQWGLLSSDDAHRIETLLRDMGLPTRSDAKKDELKEAIRKDKKRDAAYVNFVLLKGIGEAVVEQISLEELESAIDDMC